MTAPARGRAWLPLLVVALLTLGAAFFLADPLGRLKDVILGAPQPPNASDVTLLELQRTSQLRAASGTFSVPVYYGMDESGLRQYIPDVLDQDAGVAIYQGSVDALIELDGLTRENLSVDKATNTVTITLPPPTLTEPNIDEERSRVVVQQRGLTTRVKDFFAAAPLQKKQELDREAVAALRAAAAQSELGETARANGRDFLVSVAKRMGFTYVVVRYSDEATTPGQNN
ncbi:MAG: DUF4230 domain-containing protein [Tetrasphaera sp.]